MIRLNNGILICRSAEETAKYVSNEFTLRKRIFDSVLKILERFLGFMIFNVVIGMYGNFFHECFKVT